MVGAFLVGLGGAWIQDPERVQVGGRDPDLQARQGDWCSAPITLSTKFCEGLTRDMSACTHLYTQYKRSSTAVISYGQQMLLNVSFSLLVSVTICLFTPHPFYYPPLPAHLSGLVILQNKTQIMQQIATILKSSRTC